MIDWRAKLDGRYVIASVSGGKDSAAMSLWLTEQGIEHERVFADTGWEHEETYRYLWDVLVPKLGPITVVHGPLSFEDLVQKKGTFPSRIRRFCTQSLKIFPLRDYILSRIAAGHEVVNAIGVRAGESAARARMTSWEWQEDFNCDVWRPLLSWTEPDVIAMHHRHGLPPNPLYLMGAERVGCWPCIFSRKAEIRLIAEVDPARIDRIRAMEQRATDVATARYAAKGETFESLGYARPTFFYTHTAKSSQIPIDDVVDWSRTARGGKQRELFATGEAGCVRWGMCDTPADLPDAPKEKP